MPYLSSDGANLFVHVVGEGTPHLFVHGFGLDHRQWTPQIETFAAVGQFVGLDVRGHGESGAPEHGYTWAQSARDVLRVMTQVGMDRRTPGFIVAQSWMADAALQAALAEPRALRGVVVVSPAVWGQPGGNERGAEWDALRAHARQHGPGAALERWRDDAQFDALRAYPGIWNVVLDMQARCVGRHWTSVETEAGETTWARLGGCKVPVVVVIGSADRQERLDAASALVHQLPEARTVRLVGIGHYPNIEAAGPFNGWVQGFLHGNDAAAT